MTQIYGMMGTAIRKLKSSSGMDIEEMFGNCIRLPWDFGHAVRKRLFFPLAHLLAVSLSDAHQG
jgi:hypothetical protein